VSLLYVEKDVTSWNNKVYRLLTSTMMAQSNFEDSRYNCEVFQCMKNKNKSLYIHVILKSLHLQLIGICVVIISVMLGARNFYTSALKMKLVFE